MRYHAYLAPGAGSGPPMRYAICAAIEARAGPNDAFCFVARSILPRLLFRHFYRAYAFNNARVIAY